MLSKHRNTISFDHTLILWGILAVFAEELIRVAWMSDDAAITLRSVLNFIHGYGLTFNMDERVQAFTHPLWCLMISGMSIFIQDVFLSTWALSITFSLIAMWLLIKHLAIDFWLGIIAALVLMCSKAYIDFSASGLENPLSHVLLLVTVLYGLAVFQSLESNQGRFSSTPSLTRLFLCCSCLYLTRPDLMLMVLPLAGFIISRVSHFKRTVYVISNPTSRGLSAGSRNLSPSLDPADKPRDVGAVNKVRNSSIYGSYRQPKAVFRSLIIGMLPAFLWTLFSLYYYGFPLPNTAYAKLATGISEATLLQQGMRYFLDSLYRDPLTLCFISLGVIVGLRSSLFDKCLALGIIFYLIYILSIGGDFMSGRYLTVPLLMACVLFVRASFSQRQLKMLILGIVCLALFGLPATLLSNNRYTNVTISPAGITDERGFYFQYTGLFFYQKHHLLPSKWNIKNRSISSTCGGLGLEGLKGGPGKHWVDICGLADPLLAHMKAKPFRRIGHYYRNVPKGYIASIEKDANLLYSPNLKTYYDSIRIVTRSPLNSSARLKEIIRLNLGLSHS